MSSIRKRCSLKAKRISYFKTRSGKRELALRGIVAASIAASARFRINTIRMCAYASLNERKTAIAETIIATNEAIIKVMKKGVRP